MVRHLGIDDQNYEEDYEVVGQDSTGSAFGYVPSKRRYPLYLRFIGLTATEASKQQRSKRPHFYDASPSLHRACSPLSLVPCCSTLVNGNTCTILIWKSQTATSVQSSGNTRLGVILSIGKAAWKRSLSDRSRSCSNIVYSLRDSLIPIPF